MESGGFDHRRQRIEPNRVGIRQSRWHYTATFQNRNSQLNRGKTGLSIMLNSLSDSS